MIKNYYKLIVALVFATNVFGQNLPSYLPKNGLVGWWPFNGNANDESGNGNHGTVNGATLTTDRNGISNQAYSFKGAPDRIDVGNINNKNISISSWILNNLTDNNLRVFIAKYAGDPFGSYEFNIAGQTLNFHTSNNTIDRYALSTSFISTTPKVNPTVTTCAGNSISFEATGATGIETYNWYDVAEGGTPIATSQIFKTPVLNYGENKTYWVSITNGVCESTRARVDVIVKELPTVKKPENYSVCAGEFIQSLNFAVTPQGATNYWSNDNLAIGLQKNGMGAIPGFVSQNSTGSPLVSNITVTPSFNGCIGKSETFKIYVIPTPKVAITNLKPIVFTTDAPFALVGEPSGGNFIGEAIEGNNFTPAKATLGKKSIEYKYISKDGCGGAAIASIIVVDTNGVVCTKYDTIKVKETIYDTVLKITFKLTTGINISKTTSLSVYPNPTADILIIDAADVAAMSGYSYQLLDAVGKEIYSQLVTSKKTEISLKTLGAKGVYLLHVLDANNQSVVSKKIVLE